MTKFVVLCAAASLAAVCAEIEPGMRTSWRRQHEFDGDWSKEPISDNAGLPQQFAADLEQYGYPQYPPQYPQSLEPGRELPDGRNGSIKVRNDGLFTVLQFHVDYQLKGRKMRKESGKIPTGLARIIAVPAHAQEITVTVQYVGLFDITSDIHVRQFKYPVIRCYSSKDGRTVNEVGC